jgi:cyclopropane-fatty-acyl-phospholipid synthase
MSTTTTTKLSIAEAFGLLIKGDLPMRFTAYDGSSVGPEDSPIGFHVATERGLAYLMSSPDPDLALGRAYVAGDLRVSGVHPGDPYDAIAMLKSIEFRRPRPSELVAILRSLGLANLRSPAPPPQEAPSRRRRVMDGFRHTLVRDATAIHHHYDVSNRFYEMVLGPSMTYTCALFPHESATLEEAQAAKYDLIARKLDLKPGQRLLDLGCGWGGMVRHAAREYGVHVIGVTLSRQQAEWAQAEIKRQGLDDLAEVRHLDYRLVEETGFDAISSIGLTSSSRTGASSTTASRVPTTARRRGRGSSSTATCSPTASSPVPGGS